jgi:hypothetical protein
MNAIETILSNLAALQGEDEVRAACRRFALGKIPVALDASIADLSDADTSVSSDVPKRRGRPSSSSEKKQNAKAKAKKEHKPRGQTSWNKLVEATLKEMRDAHQADHPDEDAATVAKAVPYKIAFEEAGKRKRASDPEAQRLFHEKKAAKAATKLMKLPPLPLSSKTSQTEKTGVNTIYDVDEDTV